MPEISVIIPLRNTEKENRDLERLRNCLRSLEKQTAWDKMEIIVSDIDSDKKYKDQHKEICHQSEHIKYIYTKTDKLWNINRARNIGIRNAVGKYVMVTDADCIFVPNFIETVLKYADERKIIHCRITHLPENFTGLATFADMKKAGRLQPPSCYGGCQVVPRSWVMKVHGYDEDFETWGADDTDFKFRALADGFEEIWIDDEVSYFHQWHSQDNRSENPYRLMINRGRLKLTQEGKLPIKRNPRGWGGKMKKERKFNDTAVIIPTFMRDAYLFRSVESVRKYYPSLAIYVGDSGNGTDEKREFCKKHNCKYFELRYGTGVTAVRNSLLSKLPEKYKYIVIIEDDVQFQDETDLALWRKILDADEKVGIVGGMLNQINRAGMAEQNYEAILEIEDDVFCVDPIKEPEWKKAGQTEYHYADNILSVFMMRREVWKEQKWDERFGAPDYGEHSDFFYSLKLNTKWRVAYCPKVRLIHDKTLEFPEYLPYRRRPNGFKVFFDKWNVTKFKTYWNQIKTEPKVGKTIYADKDSILRENMAIAIDVLNGLNIKWYLTCGNLLSFIREGSFTALTQDIDICISPGQVDRYDEIKQGLLDRGFRLYREWKHEDYKTEISLKRRDYKLDIFFYFEKGVFWWMGVFGPDERGRWGKNLQFIPYVFRKETFGSPIEVTDGNLRFYIPEHAEDYLEQHYGLNWRKPVHPYRYYADCHAIDKNFFKPHSEKVVYIFGSWDEINYRHIELIDRAREYGGKLIVGVMSDEALKGIIHPNQKEIDRIRYMANLKTIDRLLRQDEKNPAIKLESKNIIPDYLIQSDNLIPVPGEQYVKSNGGKVIYLKMPEVTKKTPSKLAGKKGEKIAIGIKTFMREQTFFKCLEGIKKNFPYPYRFYIVDEKGEILHDKEIMYYYMEQQGHIVSIVPFGYGLSAARNMIIEKTKEDVILIMDDDILINDPTAIEKMYDLLLSSPEIGIVAGRLYEEDGQPYKSKDYGFGLNFRLENYILYREASKNIHERNGYNYTFADQVINFFLAKREVFDKVRWNNKLIIQYDHIDFFLKFKQTQWKAAVVLDAKAIHLNSGIDSDYNYFRNKGVKSLFLSENNLDGYIDRFN